MAHDASSAEQQQFTLNVGQDQPPGQSNYNTQQHAHSHEQASRPTPEPHRSQLGSGPLPSSKAPSPNEELAADFEYALKRKDAAHERELQRIRAEHQQELQRIREVHTRQLAQELSVPVEANLWGTRGHFGVKWSTTKLVDGVTDLRDAVDRLAATTLDMAKRGHANVAQSVQKACPVIANSGALELFTKLCTGAKLIPKEARLVADLISSHVLLVLHLEVWCTPFLGLPGQVQWADKRVALETRLRQGQKAIGAGQESDEVAEYIELTLRFHRDQARYLWQHYSTVLQSSQADSGSVATGGTHQHPSSGVAAIRPLQQLQALVAGVLLKEVANISDAVPPPQLWQCAMAVAGEAIKMQLLTTAVHPEITVEAAPVGIPPLTARNGTPLVQSERGVQLAPSTHWAKWTQGRAGPTAPGCVLANLSPIVKFVDGSGVLVQGKVLTSVAWAPHDTKGALILC